jgi:hypothetical protein
MNNGGFKHEMREAYNICKDELDDFKEETLLDMEQ